MYIHVIFNPNQVKKPQGNKVVQYFNILNSVDDSPKNVPFMADRQSANRNSPSFTIFPVPESMLLLGEIPNSIESLCSATFPMLAHMTYQIPAVEEKNM